MGWDEPTYYHKLGKTEALDNFKADGIAGIEVLNDSDEIKILDIFRKFNSTGKLEATKRLEE